MKQSFFNNLNIYESKDSNVEENDFLRLDHLNINYFLELEEILSKSITKKMDNKKHLLTFNELYSVLSISKAEDSDLTINEAVEIQRVKTLNEYSQKIKSDFENLDKQEKNYLIKAKKLYHKLEFANILSGYRYISNNNVLDRIKEQGITLELLQEIHSIVTANIDDIFRDKGIENFYPYYSGKIRDNNNITIGKHKPIDYTLLSLHIQEINKSSKNINSLDDIFQLHGHLYYSHFFNNGNKRTIRLLEIALLRNIGFSGFLDPNIGYNLQKSNYIKTIVDYSVGKRQTIKNIDLGKSSMILSALYILDKELKQIKSNKIRQYKNQDFEILFLLINGSKIKSKNLKFLYDKKYKKMTDQGFYKKLENEINKSDGFIKREISGKNVFYSLNLNDKHVDNLQELFDFILIEYKKYNNSYNEIDFLKNY